MTKVWNDMSWSDRDSAEAMVGGESRTLESRPSDARVTVRKTFTISLSLGLDSRLSSTRRQHRRKRIFKISTSP